MCTNNDKHCAGSYIRHCGRHNIKTTRTTNHMVRVAFSIGAETQIG